MGKIFLVVLLCVAGYSIYAVGSKVMGWGEKESESVPPVIVDPKPEKQSVEVVVHEQESHKADLPEALFVLARSSDWLMVHEWGICRAGDWLPCGRILRKWSDRLAVVFDGQKEVVLRFARGVEFPTYRAQREAPVLPNIGGPPAPVSPDGSSVSGSSEGVGQLVTDFFGGGSK